MVNFYFKCIGEKLKFNIRITKLNLITNRSYFIIQFVKISKFHATSLASNQTNTFTNIKLMDNAVKKINHNNIVCKLFINSEKSNSIQ